jgi:predicted ATPase
MACAGRGWCRKNDCHPSPCRDPRRRCGGLLASDWGGRGRHSPRPGSLLRSSRQQLHAQIAEALEANSPELMGTQPELFAQHYAEAGLVEKSVAYWGKAGRRSVARSAMAEAAAQLQKGLDQLALLADGPERQRQELEFCSALGAALIATKGNGAPETGHAYARTLLHGSIVRRREDWTVYQGARS